MKSWADNNVSEIIPNKNQRCVSILWACSMKTTKTGFNPKA